MQTDAPVRQESRPEVNSSRPLGAGHLRGGRLRNLGYRLHADVEHSPCVHRPSLVLLRVGDDGGRVEGLAVMDVWSTFGAERNAGKMPGLAGRLVRDLVLPSTLKRHSAQGDARTQPGSAVLQTPSLNALLIGDAFATYAVTTGARARGRSVHRRRGPGAGVPLTDRGRVCGPRASRTRRPLYRRHARDRPTGARVGSTSRLTRCGTGSLTLPHDLVGEQVPPAVPMPIASDR